MKKKIILFSTIALLFCAQIVKAATDIKDATLDKKGTQNYASTMAWLKDANPDASLITMKLKDFYSGFKDCILEFNQKYQTFTVVNSQTIDNEVLPKLYAEKLIKGKIYMLSYWNVTTGKFGKAARAAEEGEYGLFFPGWEDPIMSILCWNFSYPTDKPVAPPVATRVETVILPGVNKYFYKTDTIRERYDSYKEIENNFFVTKNNNTFTKIDNQSFTVEDYKTSYASNKQNDCGCPEQRVSSCGCDDNHICRKHYDQLPNKHKKNFFNTAGGRVLTHVAAAVGGYFLGRWIFGDGDDSAPVQSIFTHGPFDPVVTNPTPIVFTQGPYN